MKETQSEFIARYLKGGEFTEKEMNENGDMCAIFCDCEEEEGAHWGMIRRSNMRDHLNLHFNENHVFHKN